MGSIIIHGKNTMGGPYYYNGDSVQEGNVCFDAILDSICVFDSDSVNAGTVVYQVVDFVNIYNILT